MRARPVIGGVFIKMLEDPATWKKWASRDRANVGEYAPIIPLPRITEIVPTAERDAATWRFTLVEPPEDWSNPASMTRTGRKAPAASAARELPAPSSARPGTRPISGCVGRSACLHDSMRIVFSSACITTRTSRSTSTASRLPKSRVSSPTIRMSRLPRAARAKLKPERKVVLAVHCHQSTGGQGVNVGLVEVEE